MVYGLQLFVAGLAWFWVLLLLGAGVFGAWQAYLWLPHFAERVNDFLDPASLGYQIERALRAVAAGGLFGRGPGEGIQKWHLPDAHADFIFAATAEEFGIVACLALVALFAFLILRGLWRVNESSDRFVQLAATGLIAELGLQALINMAVNLNLIPTKGMTLPFISYGGSSLLALAIAHGHAAGAEPARRPAAAAATPGAAALDRPDPDRGRRDRRAHVPGHGARAGAGRPRLAGGPAHRPARRALCRQRAALHRGHCRQPLRQPRGASARASGSWRAACSTACWRCAASGRSRPPRSAATPRSRPPWPRRPAACRCWSTSRTPCSAGPTG